ncbi:MAG: hypothetical protein ACOX1Q_04225 [Eubacteriales bacterium]
MNCLPLSSLLPISSMRVIFPSGVRALLLLPYLSHISKHTAEHIKQPRQHIEIKGEGGLAACIRLRVDGLIRYGEIIGMNVTDTFRQKPP